MSEANEMTYGPPQATEHFTVEELQKLHMVGVYINGEWKTNRYVNPTLTPKGPFNRPSGNFKQITSI